MAAPLVGFHGAHEQHAPSRLLALLQQAEVAGFSAGSCSDHFHPWSRRQGQSGFSWCWLGAALQATSLPLSVVCAPGARHHPAVLAQAVATLLDMYPGRFELAVGSGEALNESITGAPWPEKSVRKNRLRESVEIMRALWGGETVTSQGLIAIREATLFTRPAKMPLIIGAALTESTAAWLGGWADGLITAGASHTALQQVVEAFRGSGGEGKPLYLQAALSYGRSDAEAIAAAHDQWRHAALDPQLLADLPNPDAFDKAAASIAPDQLRDKLHISADWRRHLDWLLRAAELGFSRVFLFNVNRNMDPFVNDFGEFVLPEFARHFR